MHVISIAEALYFLLPRMFSEINHYFIALTNLLAILKCTFMCLLQRADNKCRNHIR
jgi:hypothetical protein